eukprot:1836950-Pyramimonas_sp.AAC.1
MPLGGQARPEAGPLSPSVEASGSGRRPRQRQSVGGTTVSLPERSTPHALLPWLLHACCGECAPILWARVWHSRVSADAER